MKEITGVTEAGEEVFSKASDYKELKEKYKGGLIIVLPVFLCVPKSELTKVTAEGAWEVRQGRALALPATKRLSFSRFARALEHQEIEDKDGTLAKLAETMPEFS